MYSSSLRGKKCGWWMYSSVFMFLLPEVFSAVREIEDSELFMPSHSLRCVKGAFPPKGFYEEPA